MGKSMRKIGVILAGGQSRRMGKDKATIIFNGQTFLDHTIQLLKKWGSDDIVVLGRPDIPLGIRDPREGAGPAANLQAWINTQKPPFRMAVLPVDMPLLSVTQLHKLDSNPTGGFFDDLYLPIITTIGGFLPKKVSRMKDLLSVLSLQPIAIPDAWRNELTNFNTVESIRRLCVDSNPTQ